MVNKASSKATDRLLALCGHKLVADCLTCWSSTFLMLQRLLCVKAFLSTVLDELEWDNLPISDWKILENITTLLKPFTKYTSLVSGEEYATISSVIPIIMELNTSRRNEKRTLNCLSTAASVWLVELKHIV